MQPYSTSVSNTPLGDNAPLMLSKERNIPNPSSAPAYPPGFTFQDLKEKTKKIKFLVLLR